MDLSKILELEQVTKIYHSNKDIIVVVKRKDRDLVPVITDTFYCECVTDDVLYNIKVTTENMLTALCETDAELRAIVYYGELYEK